MSKPFDIGLIEEIRSLLEGYMAKYGVTQVEVAERVETSQQNIQRFLNGAMPLLGDRLDSLVAMLRSKGMMVPDLATPQGKRARKAAK